MTVLMTGGELRACDSFIYMAYLGNIFTLHLLIFNFSSGIERLIILDSLGEGNVPLAITKLSRITFCV